MLTRLFAAGAGDVKIGEADGAKYCLNIVKGKGTGWSEINQDMRCSHPSSSASQRRTFSKRRSRNLASLRGVDVLDSPMRRPSNSKQQPPKIPSKSGEKSAIRVEHVHIALHRPRSTAREKHLSNDTHRPPLYKTLTCRCLLFLGPDSTLSWRDLCTHVTCALYPECDSLKSNLAAKFRMPAKAHIPTVNVMGDSQLAKCLRLLREPGGDGIAFIKVFETSAVCDFGTGEGGVGGVGGSEGVKEEEGGGGGGGEEGDWALGSIRK